MKRVTQSHLEKIANLERKILILSELHANSTYNEERKILSDRIDELHEQMYNSTRWLLKPISNTILEDQVIIKQQGFNFKIEDKIIKDITNGSDI